MDLHEKRLTTKVMKSVASSEKKVHMFLSFFGAGGGGLAGISHILLSLLENSLPQSPAKAAQWNGS